MADSVVTFLLEYLSDRLKEEANFLDGVNDEVKSLQDELRFINIFLESSAEKRNNKIVKEVVRQIREVAYKAEDVIDRYIDKVAEHRRLSLIGRIRHYASHISKLRNVGKNILSIKDKINEIYRNRERYGIEGGEATVNAAEEEAMHTFRREVEEDDVVGFVDDSTTLVKQLTEGDAKLDVISIIGMGGLGKTTLARKIYKKLSDMRQFDCHVWFCVSQDFKTRELWLKILKELGLLGMGLEDKSEDELKRELFRNLHGKKFLVVLDDIWRSGDWKAVRSAFPDNSNGSRILITSRNKEVASCASDTPPYILRFLKNDESWELFRKKVFLRGTCPPELETLGKQIAEGCKGLPLSIVVIAGVLANKAKSLHIWSKYVGHVTNFLIAREEDTTICQKILSLSYTDLPLRLKPCFLYFSMYPEDFEIPVKGLMRVWVAEGFIKYTGNRFPEDVADIYLEELIDRSLIQVVSRRTDGGVKTCRIHDLLRDLSIQESKEDKFLEVQSNNHLSTNNSRRLCIQGDIGQYMSSNLSVPKCARSLFFNTCELFDPVTWTWLKKNFKLLRVLDDVSFIDIPKGIATFIHLRHLTLNCMRIVFTDSIGNLTNLETLIVRVCSSESGRYLPKGIFKLQRLRNLYLSNGWSLPCNSQEALRNLEVLSTLIDYDLQNHSFRFVPEMFPKLRKWKILTWIGSDIKGVFPSLDHLAHLEILRVARWGMLPENLISIPLRITKLTLTDVVKVGCCVTMLGKLPNLRILKLNGVCNDILPCIDNSLSDVSDISIHVTAGSFPQLHALKLRKLKIKERKQERGAMPRLRRLIIIACTSLISPPELWSLTTLQYVEAISSSKWSEMLGKLQEKVGFKLLIR